MADVLQALETDLGYQFRDRELLQRALTHRSRAYEQGSPTVVADNEQLEFLGDSILGFVASEWLVSHFPHFAEGRLSKMKAHLVSASHLLHAAQEMGLGQHLLLGRGEEMSGGRGKKTLLADAIEALIAALYIDGGMDVARSFIVNRVLSDFNPSEADGPELVNFKGALAELTQTLDLPRPEYRILEERGPDHSKTFLIEVRVGDDWVGRAEGVSKKSASQAAAKDVLTALSKLSNS